MTLISHSTVPTSSQLDDAVSSGTQDGKEELVTNSLVASVYDESVDDETSFESCFMSFSQDKQSNDSEGDGDDRSSASSEVYEIPPGLFEETTLGLLAQPRPEPVSRLLLINDQQEELEVESFFPCESGSDEEGSNSECGETNDELLPIFAGLLTGRSKLNDFKPSTVTNPNLFEWALERIKEAEEEQRKLTERLERSNHGDVAAEATPRETTVTAVQIREEGEMHAKVAQLENDIVELKVQEALLVQEVKELKENLTNREAIIKSTEALAARAKVEIWRWKNEVGNKCFLEKEVEDELAKASAVTDNEELKGLQHTASEYRLKMKKTVASLEGGILSLKRRLEKAVQDHERTNLEYREEMEKSLATLKSQNARDLEEISTLRQEKMTLRIEIQELGQTMSRRRQLHDALRAELDQTKSKLITVQKDLVACKAGLDASDVRVSVLTHDLESEKKRSKQFMDAAAAKVKLQMTFEDVRVTQKNFEALKKDWLARDEESAAEPQGHDQVFRLEVSRGEIIAGNS